MYDSQPTGARSRQTDMDKRIEKQQQKQKLFQSKETQAAKDADEVEEPPGLTPTPAVIANASATAFRHLTQNRGFPQGLLWERQI